MIRLKIENSRGSIEMGSYGFPLWRIIDFDGLGLPAPERSVQSYAGQLGQTCISETVKSRAITIAGELIQIPGIEAVRTQAHRILLDDVRLTVNTGRKKRCIDGKCTAFEFEKPNKYLQTWVMQFICDDPRFRDVSEKSVSVFERKKLIDRWSHTPCMFSQRTSKASINNMGDYESEPIIEISSGAAYSGRIELRNNTTGAHAAFVHDIKADDVIKVDIPNRRIVSAADGVITRTITDDTFLSAFTLARGINELEVVSDNVNLTAVCRYYNYYCEAVI